MKSAWGDRLEVEPRKFIGAALYMRGVHELAVCELLWRLAETGETALDAGANIGVMTSLLSKKVAARGRVLAFEAHPVLFQRLEQNVGRWEGRHIELFNCALSNNVGMADLCEGNSFSLNEGTARLGVAFGPGKFHRVKTVRLDDVVQGENCGVAKIDVEEHEVEVLLGAIDTLRQRRLRDVVFESTWDFPAPAHELLLRHNYRIFEIQHAWRGPRLAEVQRRSRPGPGLADYLATINAPRALELAKPAGWQVLKRANSERDKIPKSRHVVPDTGHNLYESLARGGGRFMPRGNYDPGGPILAQPNRDASGNGGPQFDGGPRVNPDAEFQKPRTRVHHV